jgi:3-isopropylmalate/(R)-2-methylmalate dehydratase small subunit
MLMGKIIKFSAQTVNLPNEDIDTDQIIPARFLAQASSFEDIGKDLFADWRYEKTGELKQDFVLNQPEASEAEVLVAGNNFGCGSSREHAPWALVDFGFKAIISTSFADIFQNNALKNGLIPIVVDRKTHQWLLDHPATMVTIDLDVMELSLENGNSVPFPIEPFSRYCLMSDINQLDYILRHDAEITAFENK